MGFTQSSGRTRLDHVEQQPPWKVIRSFSNDSGEALVHLHNVSGGILSTDHLEAQITVGCGCQAQITTTSATRIYRARTEKDLATQKTSAVIENGAVLEYLPDALIPFARSRYSQKIEFNLHEDAGLFCWEIIAPGRTQECFAFDLLQMQTAITTSSGCIFHESSSLQPASQNLQAATRMGGFAYHAAMYVCRTGLPQTTWHALEKEMAYAIHSWRSEHQIWGVSRLRQDGLILRGLSLEAPFLVEGCLKFWRKTKLALYGVEPVPPRKLL